MPIRSIATFTLTLAVTTAAFAIQPGNWTHTTEADFEPGDTEGVVVTNLGDIKLATGSTVVGTMPEGVNIIYDMRGTANGDIYLAAGPEGRLLRRRADKIEQVADLSQEQIFALDQAADGSLILAISGETSRLAILDGDKIRTLVELPGIRYIWDTLVDGNDVYLATGIEGKLLHVNLTEVFAAATKPAEPPKPVPVDEAPKADPVAKKDDTKKEDAPKTDKPKEEEKPKALPAGVRVLYDSAQANILCLGRDRQGRIYAGTDTDGLVYRVTMQPGGIAEPFVLFDAPEPEIGALLVLADGTVYAGTADADQARPGRLEAAAAKEEGRPAKETPKIDTPELPIPPRPKPPEPPKNGDKPDGKATTPGAANVAPADTATANGSATVASAEPVPPTPEQYDQLREEIQSRLQKARQTGELQTNPSLTPSPSRRAGVTTPSRPTGRAGAAAKQGNAVYRIDTGGFVAEVFRETAMILRILDDGDRLLVATGNEGQLFRVDVAGEETTIVADLEPAQVPALMKGADGRVLVGTANPATLVRLDESFATTGTYTSTVMDASQISLWGKLLITAGIPAGTSVGVQTRSGNVQDPDRAAWSKWSVPRNLMPEDAVTPLTPREITITSPPARFLQYRFVITGNGKDTAVVDRVSLAYVVPNIRPSVNAVRTNYPGAARPAPRAGTGAADAAPAEQVVLNIDWEASDANGDAMRYTLEYQMAGTKKWLPLAEDLDATTYAWQTKRVPDGRYIIRVTASDAPDNPETMARTASRQSDPVLIDNTPPAIAERQTRVENGVVTMSATVTDNLSAIKAVYYAVDTANQWKPVLPDDLIFDSTKETITVKIAGLSAGSHVITLRASDALGNTQYVAEVVEIK